MEHPVATRILDTVQVLSKKVMLVFPWYKTSNPLTAFSVMQLSDKRRTASMICHGDAFVAHTRNTCADVFLQSSLDYMLTIDDDMVVPFGNGGWFRQNTGWANYPDPFASFNALDRLVSHGKTLVGALYFGRQQGYSRPVFNEGASNKVAEADARNVPRDELKPTKWVGTGCMLIHRSVFEDIEKKFPNLARGANKKGGQWFTSSEHTAIDWLRRCETFLSQGPMDGEKAYQAHSMVVRALGEAKANSGLGMGEDVTFCTRAREAGHQPFVDFGLVAGHIGYHVYGPKG